MKKRKLKKWVKVALYIIIGLLFINLIIYHIKDDDELIKKCIKMGYNKEYCYKQILGN